MIHLKREVQLPRECRVSRKEDDHLVEQRRGCLTKRHPRDTVLPIEDEVVLDCQAGSAGGLAHGLRESPRVCPNLSDGEVVDAICRCDGRVRGQCDGFEGRWRCLHCASVAVCSVWIDAVDAGWAAICVARGAAG